MKPFAALVSFLALIASPSPARADSGARTDINPVLLYSQAIQVMPDRAVQDHLFTNEWKGQPLDEPFDKQISTYNNAFKLLRLAARQKAPCDWGYDYSQGPELLLPSLSKAKLLAQAGRLRVRWHLENGRPDDARDDLLAVFVLGRQVSRDGILISALVQFAIENITVSTVAENWFRFRPETLQQVLDGIAAAPARGSIAQCIPTERTAFKDWLARKVADFQSTSRDEAEAIERTRVLMHSLMDQGEESPKSPNSPTPESIIRAAGGTTAGLLRQLKDMDALYDEGAVLMTTPYAQFVSRIKAFNQKIEKHPNQMVQIFFPAFEKCRFKEFTVETKVAMLRAAAAYRQLGEAGLGQVPDPQFNEPFQFRRAVLDGLDRGFELRSRLEVGGVVQAQIFVEKDGPAFYLDGPKVGKPVK